MNQEHKSTGLALLKAARKRIAESGVEFICHALYNAFHEESCGTYQLVDTAKDRVMQAIVPHSTFESWFRRNHGYVPDDMRQVRLEFMDRWIEATEKALS